MSNRQRHRARDAQEIEFTEEQLSTGMRRVRMAIQASRNYYEVSVTLRDPQMKERYAATLDRFAEFFQPTKIGLTNLAVVSICRPFERGLHAPGFETMINLARRFKSIPEQQAEALMRQLETELKSVRKLKFLRNKLLAHLDFNVSWDTLTIDQIETYPALLAAIEAAERMYNGIALTLKWSEIPTACPALDATHRVLATLDRCLEEER